MNNSIESEGFMNLFSLLLFMIILICFLYFASKQIKNIFKIEDFEKNNNEKEDKKENENEKEKFINLYSLNDFLFDIDENGNFMNSTTQKEKDKNVKNNILKNVIHKKNIEVNENKEDKEDKEDKNKEDKNKEDKNKEDKNKEDKNKEDKNKEDKEVKNNKNESITYIMDKNSNKKNIYFVILNEQKLKYLECKGFYDEHIVININTIKNNEITKIINKIYNKYTFVYQTKDDNEPIHYFIEYRPSQERFIKLYNQNEDKVFYLEKIFYKEHKNNNDNSIPLYNIYHYANQIGTIYSNLVEDNNTKVYQMRLNKEFENNKNIISFSFILYLSFLKEEF